LTFSWIYLTSSGPLAGAPEIWLFPGLNREFQSLVVLFCACTQVEIPVRADAVTICSSRDPGLRRERYHGSCLRKFPCVSVGLVLCGGPKNSREKGTIPLLILVSFLETTTRPMMYSLGLMHFSSPQPSYCAKRIAHMGLTVPCLLL
jgi:hypothetical protein